MAPTQAQCGALLPVGEAALAAFGKKLGLANPVVDLPSLTAIIRTTMERVYFSNIMMLVRQPRRRPTADDIAEDMLLGIGGPCTVFNPFMATFLRYLGFDAALVPAYMGGVLKHITIVVALDGERWFVDFGNGYPYLNPCSLNASTIHEHAGMCYRMVPRDATHYEMEHRFHRGAPLEQPPKFRTNFKIRAQPVPLSYFADMTLRHYTCENFGHFLKVLRLIKFPGGEMIALRGDKLITSADGRLHCTQLADRQAVIAAVKEHFPIARECIDSALASLGRKLK